MGPAKFHSLHTFWKSFKETHVSWVSPDLKNRRIFLNTLKKAFTPYDLTASLSIENVVKNISKRIIKDAFMSMFVRSSWLLFADTNSRISYENYYNEYLCEVVLITIFIFKIYILNFQFSFQSLFKEKEISNISLNLLLSTYTFFLI